MVYLCHVNSPRRGFSQLKACGAGWLDPPESGNFPMSQDEIIRNLMKSLKRKQNGYSCYTVVKESMASHATPKMRENFKKGP